MRPIVDLDGTLVDTLGDFSAALNAMLETGLPPMTPAAIEASSARARNT